MGANYKRVDALQDEGVTKLGYENECCGDTLHVQPEDEIQRYSAIEPCLVILVGCVGCSYSASSVYTMNSKCDIVGILALYDDD